MENNSKPKHIPPVREAIAPPRPVTYRFMAELDKACNEFFKKRGIKWPS